MAAESIAEWVRRPLSLTRSFVAGVVYAGRGRWCPVCEKESRKFRAYGLPPREDALCAHCHSLERHRFLWLHLCKATNLFDGKARKILHVAPERCLEPRLKKRLGKGYLTADLLDPRAMVRMDVTEIQYPDEYFDVIYCSHVLEHVANDRKAMREFHRVLKKDGWAVLNVPITAEASFEDPSITDPSARVKAFGQADHVRRYGIDYIDRLGEAGFNVKVVRVSDLVDSGDRLRMGLTPITGEIFQCYKG